MINIIRKAVYLIILATLYNNTGLFSQDSPGNYIRKLPGNFIENAGQWDKQARFLSQSAGRDVWITNEGITFDYYEYNNYKTLSKPGILPDEINNIDIQRNGHVIRMNFRGNTSVSRVIGTGKQSGYNNYFIGNNPEYWKSNVAVYNEVSIVNLYNNIDAVIYNDGMSVRYDFRLKPGSNPEDINIEFKGQDKIEVDNYGHLIISTALGNVQHNSIYAYQVIKGVEVRVECSFRQAGKFMKFELGKYDNSSELIIDPLVYSTFIGPTMNSVDQLGLGMATSGNAVYLTGTAASAGFPVTPGSYSNNVSIANNFHVFVTKIIPDKSLPPDQQLVFSTFFGGKENEFGYDIALDKDNDIYITGTTSSTDFPITANTFDKNGGWNDVVSKKIGDGFIAKLSGDGKNLLYSTFMGEDRYFYTTSIDVDANKMVYVTGYSNCTFFKPSQNAGYLVNRGEGTDWDIIMMKLDLSAGKDGMKYFSFYGGNQNDEGYKIKAFDNGNIYIAGQTKSANFPVTAGTAPSSSTPDVFALRMDFNQSGSASRKDAFVFGGSDIDIAYDMAADNNEILYITGYTFSNNFPVTADALYNKQIGDKDIFISKVDFSKTPNPLVFSTYFGGKQGDIAYSIISDKQTSIFLTGSTSSIDFPVTSRAYQKGLSGPADAVIAKINLLSAPPYTVQYSSYFGGSSDDIGITAGYMDDKAVVLAGITRSDDFPVSYRAFRNTGNKDTNTAFLSKIDVINEPLSYDISMDTVICSNNPANIGIIGNISGGSGNYSFNWIPADYLDNPNAKNPVILVISDTTRVLYYYLEIKDNTTNAVDEKKIKVTVKPSPKPAINEKSQTVFCQGDEIHTFTTTTVNGATSEWQATGCTPVGTPPFTGNSVGIIFNKPGIAKIRLVQTFTNTKCSDFTELEVSVNPKPEAKITGDIEVCTGCDIAYSAQQADSLEYKWLVTNGVIKGGIDNKNTLDVTWNDVGEGTGKVALILTNKNTGCNDTAIIDIKITAMPKPTILGDVSACDGDTLSYTTPQKPEAVNKWKVTGGNILGADNGSSVDVYWNSPGAAKVELNQKIQSKNYDETTELPVTIHEKPGVNITGVNTAGIGDLLKYTVVFNSNYEYDWVVLPNGMGNQDANPNPNELNVTWLAPGTAKVIAAVTSQFGCISHDTVIVIINSDIIKINGTASVCEDEEYTYTTNDFANAAVQWEITGGSIISGQGTNTIVVKWNAPGSGSLKAIHTFTSTGTKAETIQNITVNPKPPVPTITREGAALDKLVSSSAANNQWYKDGVIISGAVNREYTPDADVTAKYTVRVKNQFGCEAESAQFTFGPIKTSAEIVIRANPMEAADGEIVKIEVIINNPKDLNDVNAAKSFNLGLALKAGILIPNESKYLGTKAGDDRVVNLSIPLPSNAVSGQVLASFTCTAALDNSETTAIIPNTIEPVDGMITFTNVTNGEFTLNNVCHEGGKPRLVNSSGKLDLLNIIPNPAGSLFDVEFETIENGIHRLYLVNSTGAAEYPLMAGELKKGRYKQAFSTEGIPSGAYMLIFETPYTSKSVKVNISK